MEKWLSGLRHWFAKSACIFSLHHGFESRFFRSLLIFILVVFFSYALLYIRFRFFHRYPGRNLLKYFIFGDIVQ